MPGHEKNRMIEWPRCAWRWLSPDDWKRSVSRAAVVMLMVVLAGFAFITLGLTPIAADKGHWHITRNFLKYTMTRSVSMQSRGTQVPALDDPSLVLKGAGHYATDCMPCHSAPGQTRALVVEQMVPAPPVLADVVDDWNSRELFWIVKHGIKYTAMPAWSTQRRDDEVWAMVAFLQQLPRMEAPHYRELALGPLAAATAGAEGARISTMELPPLSARDNCARCHGADGEGRGDGAIPRLAGQREGYLLASLQAYARGERHSGIMQPVAAGLHDVQMAELARHYASLPPAAASVASSAGVDARPTEPSMAVDASEADNSILTLPHASPTPALPDSPSPEHARARGAALALHGSRHQRIPACRHCHGPGANDRNPAYPRLAGQHPGYLALQLRLFQQDRRGGTVYRQLMQDIASRLSEQQIMDLAAYYGERESAGGKPDSE